MVYIICGIVILLLLTIPLLARNHEKKAYNNGICPECETKLYRFDKDSQGGRGYVCKECSYTTWVSYPWIDN